MRNPAAHYKDRLYGQFARIGKALASPKRLELLDLLVQGERTVETLAAEAGLSVANTSRHLQVLREARLVEAEKRGLYVVYRPAGTGVPEFLAAMKALAESHLAEVDQLLRQFLAGKQGLEPVDRPALLARMKRGDVMLLDVRPVEEYRAGHLAGAVSIPLQELGKRLSELPRDQEIVAYCRGSFCLLAAQAVEILQAQGFCAAQLKDSVQDWQRRNLPVAIGEKPR